LRITGAAARARGHSLYLMIFSLTLALRRARAALTKSFFNTKKCSRPPAHSLTHSRSLPLPVITGRPLFLPPVCPLGLQLILMQIRLCVSSVNTMGRAATATAILLKREDACGFYKRISGSSNKSTQRQQAGIIAAGHAFQYKKHARVLKVRNQ
jgi:hypothetical protein